MAAGGVIPTNGERAQAQVAATLIEALGLSADRFDENAAPALREIFNGDR